MPRSKPHFKVRTTVANHEKMTDVWANNDLLAIWLRLGVLAIERFADRTADSFLVSDRELPMITGKGRLDIARTWLRRLADVSPISARREGDVWRIMIPNLSKKQGFAVRNGKESGPPPTATPTPTPKEQPLDAAPPRSTEDFPSGDELQHLAERDCRRLANCLAKLEGSPEEKRLWLESGVGGQILAAADEELDANAIPRQRSGFLVRVTMQRWNAYLKSHRPFQGPAEIQRLDAQRAREPPVEPGLPDMTAEEFQTLMAQPEFAGMFDND